MSGETINDQQDTHLVPYTPHTYVLAPAPYNPTAQPHLLFHFTRQLRSFRSANVRPSEVADIGVPECNWS